MIIKKRRCVNLYNRFAEIFDSGVECVLDGYKTPQKHYKCRNILFFWANRKRRNVVYVDTDATAAYPIDTLYIGLSKDAYNCYGRITSGCIVTLTTENPNLPLVEFGEVDSRTMYSEVKKKKERTLSELWGVDVSF